MITLKQGQLWKKGDTYYRIVIRERLGVRYKQTDGSEEDPGTFHDVPKKEFCRLLKGAVLIEEG